MSDLDSFKREIDETDALIAAIAPEGAALVEAIRKTGCTPALRDPGALYDFYYNGLTNRFHGAAGLPLLVRFNMRVHEGIHAIQMTNAPDMAKALNNLSFGSGGPVLSPEDLMISRELGEIAAHAMQAKFNALAVRQTGWREFVTAMESKHLQSFVDLQLELLEQGLDPEDIRTEVAQRFLSLETPSIPLSLFFPVPSNWKDELNSQSLIVYIQSLDALGGKIERARLAGFSETERMRVLNAFEPLACDLEILQRYSEPQPLSEFNQDLLKEIAPRFI